jgi:phage tail sheath gpL-like
MAGDIQFPTIPQNELIPLFQLEFGNSGLAGLPNQVSLIIAQTTVAASDAAPVLVPNVAWAANKWGARSVIASMVERYMAADPNGQLWAMGVADNNAGTAATGTIVFTGTATAAGTINLYIAGRYVPVAVNVGDTATVVGGNVATAINNYFDSSAVFIQQQRQGMKGVKLPCTAAAATGTVTVTASHKGTIGNQIQIQNNYLQYENQQSTPAGLTIAITAMSGGATDPTTSGFATNLGNTAYDFIAHCWATTQALTDFSNLMSFTTGRWSWAQQIYGHCWCARISADSSGSDATTFATSDYANDPHMTCIQAEGTTPSPGWDIAAAWMGSAANSLRADPALPLQTLALPNILAPFRHQEFSLATRQALLAAGVALMSYNPDRSCQIMRAVTTYTADAYGNPDASYRDTETLYTDMYIVRELKGDALATFGRCKLADNSTSFGPRVSNIATPNKIRSRYVATYRRLMKQGVAENIEAFKKGLVVQRNSQDRSRVDTLFPPSLISGLRCLATLAQPNFQ